MTSFATFLSSFVIMVIFCLVGYNFALGGGSMMDQMQDTIIGIILALIWAIIAALEERRDSDT